MRKGMLFILSVALVISQLVLYPLVGSTASLIHFSSEKEGQYNPLHPYILNWYGDVLINGGLNLSDMKLTTTSGTADVVMTTSGYIGASGIVELGTDVDLQAPIDSSNFVGKWKTYLELKPTTYLLRTHDDQYAKIRINDILPGKALFTYVLQSDSPGGEVPTEQWQTHSNIDPTKMWTIRFSKAVNATSINKNNIYVQSSTGRIIDTKLETSSDGTKVFVYAPVNGYTPGETYTLYISNTISEKSSTTTLKSNTQMKFTIAKTPPIDNIAPNSPTNVHVITEGNTYYLNWNQNSESDLAGYFIYYSLNDSNYTKLANDEGGYLFTTNKISLSKWNGSKISIYVTAVDNSGNESATSNTITATLEAKDTIPPAAPTGVTVEAMDSTVQIDWYENIELDLLGYYLYVSEGSSNNFKKATYEDGQSLIMGETIVDLFNLKNDTPYYFYLTAVDKSYNESVRSQIVSATPTSSYNTTWSGSWNSNYGVIQFTQSGASVTGTYDYGTLTGTVEGNTLKGKYYENEWSYGDFIFTMSNDGKSFSGKWKIERGINWGNWNGTRIP